jgi:predicted secreted protein
MYIGMVDAFLGDATVRFYKNGSWKEEVSMSNLKVIGVDDGSGVVTDIAGSAVIGTAKTHDPRLFWRQVPVGLETVGSWAFEIEVSSPTRLHLAAFTFDISVATSGNIRGRVPHRNDE